MLTSISPLTRWFISCRVAGHEDAESRDHYTGDEVNKRSYKSYRCHQSTGREETASAWRGDCKADVNAACRGTRGAGGATVCSGIGHICRSSKGTWMQHEAGMKSGSHSVCGKETSTTLSMVTVAGRWKTCFLTSICISYKMCLFHVPALFLNWRSIK